MNKLDYKKYLNSESWKNKRKYFLKRQECCKLCGFIGSLDVHHLSYKDLGGEKPNQCVCLCRRCHSLVHQFYKYINEHKELNKKNYGTYRIFYRIIWLDASKWKKFLKENNIEHFEIQNKKLIRRRLKRLRRKMEREKYK